MVNRRLVAAGYSEERRDDPDGIGVGWCGSTYPQIPPLPPKDRNHVGNFHLDALLVQSSDTESPSNLRVLAPCCLFRKDLTSALPAALSANPRNGDLLFGLIIKKRPKLVKLPKLTFK